MDQYKDLSAVLGQYTPSDYGISFDSWSSSGVSTRERTYPFSFSELYSQVSNPNLPEIGKEEWDKIRSLLGAEDEESLQLAFEMLNGYKFPLGIMNMVDIKKALIKFIDILNKNKKF